LDIEDQLKKAYNTESEKEALREELASIKYEINEYYMDEISRPYPCDRSFLGRRKYG
jgi:hypothetical protein